MEPEQYGKRVKMVRKLGKILLAVCLCWTLGATFITPPFVPMEMIVSAYLLGSGMGVMVGKDILEGKTKI